jgi:cytochrome c553
VGQRARIERDFCEDIVMNTWMRWTLFGVTGAVAVLAAAVGAGVLLADRRMQRTYEVPARAVAIPADAAALARGEYLYASRGCADCHAKDGGGRVFVDAPDGLYLRGPNISVAGATQGYRPQDWDRLLRHGVKPDGRAARIMPAEDTARLTDADLGALAAYVASLPPAAGGGAELRLPLPVRVLYGFGAIPPAVEKIDHLLPPAQPVAEGVTPEHGAYVAAMCTGCHGANFAGGRIPGAPPDWPAASNLTPGNAGVLARYPSADAFVAMLRSGQRPDGSRIKVMPFEALGALNDTDARAVYSFLKTLAPLPAGGR